VAIGGLLTMPASPSAVITSSRSKRSTRLRSRSFRTGIRPLIFLVNPPEAVVPERLPLR